MAAAVAQPAVVEPDFTQVPPPCCPLPAAGDIRIQRHAPRKAGVSAAVFRPGFLLSAERLRTGLFLAKALSIIASSRIRFPELDGAHRALALCLPAFKARLGKGLERFNQNCSR